jgi:hypothetical protein
MEAVNSFESLQILIKLHGVNFQKTVNSPLRSQWRQNFRFREKFMVTPAREWLSATETGVGVVKGAGRHEVQGERGKGDMINSGAGSWEGDS